MTCLAQVNNITSLHSWSNFTEGIMGTKMLSDYLEEQASNTVLLGNEVQDTTSFP